MSVCGMKAHNLLSDLIFGASITASLLDYIVSLYSLRFQGSSFMAIGNQNKFEGEWVIIGGTGVFTFAQGTITICRILDSGSSNIKEICIRAFGCTGQTTPIETKVMLTSFQLIFCFNFYTCGNTFKLVAYIFTLHACI